MSCARRPRRAADAGEERPIRPTGYAAAAPGLIITPGTERAGCPRLLAGLVGSLTPLLRDTDGCEGMPWVFMVLGLVAHRVPRSGLGARRQTGR